MTVTSFSSKNITSPHKKYIIINCGNDNENKMEIKNTQYMRP